MARQDELQKLLLARLRVKSPFYRQRLHTLPKNATAPDNWSALPFTTPDDVREQGSDMLCVSRADVARVTTLPTSGTSGPPKRIWFTDADLERTVDFFQCGMSTFTKPGQRVLVFMPGDQASSIGDLLRKAMLRMGCQAVIHGLACDPEAALDAIEHVQADVIVGLPVQVLGMARHVKAHQGRRLSAVLLSADYVAQAVRRAVEQAFQCPVFAHWGMTETGYGGGVECAARQGYHLRSLDLLVEIVDPDSGHVLQEEETGEVVITTLTAQAMPLLRYRTGDLAELHCEPCACGSRLPRLGPVQGRLWDQLTLESGKHVFMGLLDEALLGLPWVVNYQACIRDNRTERFLDLALFAPGLSAADLSVSLHRQNDIQAVLARAGLVGPDALRLGRITLGAPLAGITGSIKRSLHRQPCEEYREAIG